MNLNNLLIDSDVLEGVIRLPIQLLKPVRRAFSGSVASLPCVPIHIRATAVPLFQIASKTGITGFAIQRKSITILLERAIFQT